MPVDALVEEEVDKTVGAVEIELAAYPSKGVGEMM